MTTPKILVTGAAGRVGGTGHLVVEALLMTERTIQSRLLHKYMYMHIKEALS